MGLVPVQTLAPVGPPKELHGFGFQWVPRFCHENIRMQAQIGVQACRSSLVSSDYEKVRQQLTVMRLPMSVCAADPTSGVSVKSGPVARPSDDASGPVGLRLLVSCLAENDDGYFRRVEALVWSLRTFGGALSKAPFVAHFVEDVKPHYVSRLHDLDAQVRVVESSGERSVHANKLRMLELADQRDFDVLLALDCDIAFVGDVSPWISAERFGAKPADYDYASPAEWNLLFSRLGMVPPARTAVATSTGRPMIPYFNSGVMFIPHQLCHPLRDAWTSNLAEIYAHSDADPSILPFPFVADQVALACAIQRSLTPYTLLPVGLNFPTHTAVSTKALSAATDIRILHYHANSDAAGLLYRAKCAFANPYIDRYNRDRAAWLGIRYDGLRSPPARQEVRRAFHTRRLLVTLRVKRAMRAVRRAS